MGSSTIFLYYNVSLSTSPRNLACPPTRWPISALWRNQARYCSSQHPLSVQHGRAMIEAMKPATHPGQRPFQLRAPSTSFNKRTAPTSEPTPTTPGRSLWSSSPTRSPRHALLPLEVATNDQARLDRLAHRLRPRPKRLVSNPIAAPAPAADGVPSRLGRVHRLFPRIIRLRAKANSPVSSSSTIVSIPAGPWRGWPGQGAAALQLHHARRPPRPGRTPSSSANARPFSPSTSRWGPSSSSCPVRLSHLENQNSPKRPDTSAAEEGSGVQGVPR